MAYIYQTVLHHDSVNYVTVDDKVCNKGILRLIIDFLGSIHLLYIPAVHNYDFITHGQGFLLVMCDIYKCNPKFIFKSYKFILHILSQFKIKST